MQNEKEIKIEMLNAKGDWVEEVFKLKKYGTPWQYERDLNIAASKSTGFEGDYFMCEKYLPHVVGKDRFKLPGQEDNIKFAEMLEEFFINDPTAMQQLSQDMGFFLSPAIKIRYEKQKK